MGAGSSSGGWNHRAGSFQGDVGRHDLKPPDPGPAPPTVNVSTFGQQKGASVLDTSGNHYQFQGSLSAPHF